MTSGRIITLQDVWKARTRIASIIQRTPLLYSDSLSQLAGGAVYLKLENMNTTNSFKIRGAANKIRNLPPHEKSKGITTFSTGNFGLSVAHVARELGVHATICISNRVPEAKVNRLKETGAVIKVVGESQDDAEKYCYQLEREQGLTVIHPFDDPEVIAGQGTVGLEILEELPEVDMVLGGLSGGGLHSGLGVALKNTNPNIQLIGLSTRNGATMYESIQAGKPMIINEKNTLADSLLGGIGLDNKYTFPMVQKYVDDFLLLNEKELAEGMVFMLENHRMIIEGAAASGISAILHRKVKPGSNVVIVVSGCSVDPRVVFDLMKDKNG